VRARLTVVLLALVLAPVAAAAVPFKATLKAPATEPTINVRWWYSIKVTDLKGKPIRATITAQIVDPLGGVHPVEFSWSKTKTITNWPFRGTFRDGIKFPPEAKGFPLTIRWIVKAKGAKRILKRKVTPQLSSGPTGPTGATGPTGPS